MCGYPCHSTLRERGSAGPRILNIVHRTPDVVYPYRIIFIGRDGIRGPHQLNLARRMRDVVYLYRVSSIDKIIPYYIHTEPLKPGCEKLYDVSSCIRP